jgi:hypothetical protein
MNQRADGIRRQPAEFVEKHSFSTDKFSACGPRKVKRPESEFPDALKFKAFTKIGPARTRRTKPPGSTRFL